MLSAEEEKGLFIFSYFKAHTKYRIAWGAATSTPFRTKINHFTIKLKTGKIINDNITSFEGSEARLFCWCRSAVSVATVVGRFWYFSMPRVRDLVGHARTHTFAGDTGQCYDLP